MITVLGSINIDLTFPLEALPGAGETVLTPKALSALGGKGANQAVAAARAGSVVRFVGRVGRDAFGERARADLVRAGVDVSGLGDGDAPTGLASIFVDRGGRNAIAVASGANGLVTAGQLDPAGLAKGGLLVLQMEIPPDEVAGAIAVGKQAGARIILNLAPARALAIDALRGVDILVVNEHEAATLICNLPKGGQGVGDKAEAHAKAIEAALHSTVIITLGADGAVACRGGEVWTFAALPVTPVDTTGAGDCFVGNLAAALARGLELPDAIGRAIVAGSLACLGLGAQASYPTAADVDARLGELPPPRWQGTAT